MPVMITEDTSIDYDIQGSGPPLILINGLGFGRWAWFKQLPALSRHFRTITFDIRGEVDLKDGVSTLVDEVVALLDHLRVRKAHVLGTSLGGFVAQELALKRPDLVDRLILVCTSYGGRGPETMSPQALATMLGFGSFSPEGAVRQGLEAATSDAYRAEKPEEFDHILHARLADSLPLVAYSRQAMAGARFDVSSEIESIFAPTLVIHGTEDRYVPLANAAALAEALPEAELKVLEDAGHLVFIEQSAKVNRKVISFLKAGEKPKKRGSKDRRASAGRARKKVKGPRSEEGERPCKGRGSARWSVAEGNLMDRENVGTSLLVSVIKEDRM